MSTARSPRESLSLPEARRVALAAQGFGRARAGATADGGRRGAHRARARAAADRLGQRAGALALPAALLAARPLRPGAARAASYGGRRRRLFEYWGHEASLMPVERAAAVPLAHAARDERRRHLGPGRAVRPRAGRLLRRRCSSRSARRDRSASRRSRPAARRKGGWWGWSEGKIALEWLFWTGQVTTHSRRRFERRLRPARTRPAARRGRRADAVGRGRAPRPAADRGARARRRDRARPARLLSPRAGRRPAAHRRTGRGRRTRAGARRRLEAARLPARGARVPRADRRQGAAVAVRFAGLGARPHRAPVRLPLPHRDLHAGAQARARLLRAAVPARRPRWSPASTSRPTASAAACACSPGTTNPAWTGGWSTAHCATNWRRWRAGSGCARPGRGG